jgi:hypothetical protein
VLCGSSDRLSVHHIVKPRHGGSDDESNLITVCSTHHALLDRSPGNGFFAGARFPTPSPFSARDTSCLT